MNKRTWSGYLGVLIIPDRNTIRIAGQLTKKKQIAAAEHVTKPEGMHITLYQAKNFVGLPISVATRLIGMLNKYLVMSTQGSQILRLVTVAPDRNVGRYLFWNVESGRYAARLMTTHRMSLAFSAWNRPAADANASELVRLFGTENVLEGYEPHITLAANTNGFSKFKPFEEPMIGLAGRVVLARMGEWGRIEEILI